MSRRLPELPAEAVAEYWQLVRAALVAGGMSKAEAAAATKAFREFMKPAGWTIYNRAPEDSARLATKHAAWMRKEAEKAAAKSKSAPRLAKQPATTADRLPTKEEIEELPRWARVGFGARCARRVIPLFQHWWPDISHEHLTLVLGAIKFTENAATTPSRQSALETARNTHQVYTLSGYRDRKAILALNATYCAVSEIEAKLVAGAKEASDATVEALGDAQSVRNDLNQVLDTVRSRKWNNGTPVPPAVFGPLWPEGPPADWPELPKPTKLKVTVQVPDGLNDGAVCEKLQKLTTALARLNVAGGGHGLKLLPPIDFTQEQDKGRADVVREEGEKPKSRGNARRGH